MDVFLAGARITLHPLLKLEAASMAFNSVVAQRFAANQELRKKLGK